MYDELTIGYRDVSVVLAFPPPRADALQRPIVVDGSTVGSWKRQVSMRAVVVEAGLFGSLTRHQSEGVHTAAATYSQFLRLPLTLQRRLTTFA